MIHLKYNECWVSNLLRSKVYYLTTLNTLKLLIQLCHLILTQILLIHKKIKYIYILYFIAD